MTLVVLRCLSTKPPAGLEKFSGLLCKEPELPELTAPLGALHGSGAIRLTAQIQNQNVRP